MSDICRCPVYPIYECLYTNEYQTVITDLWPLSLFVYSLSPWALFPSLPSGLCLEKVPAASPSLSNKNTGSPSSNRSTTDREQEIITCYEKSGDIALLYLQEAEKVYVCVMLCYVSIRPPVWGCEIGILVVYCSVFLWVTQKRSSNILLAPGLPNALPMPSLWVCDEYSAVSVQVWLMHYRPWRPTGKQMSSSLLGECLRGRTDWAGKQHCLS